jgi:hypothetical protein
MISKPASSHYGSRLPQDSSHIEQSTSHVSRLIRVQAISGLEYNFLLGLCTDLTYASFRFSPAEPPEASKARMKLCDIK